MRAASVCGSRRQHPLNFTPPTITPGSDVPTVGTVETRPAEGRVCGSAYTVRVVPHSASRAEMMGQTTGPSGMQKQTPRPELRQMPNYIIILSPSIVILCTTHSSMFLSIAYSHLSIFLALAKPELLLVSRLHPQSERSNP